MTVPGKVWVVNLVGQIHLPTGIATEATFGPFFTPEEGGDWAERYRDEWSLQRIQVITLTSPGSL